MEELIKNIGNKADLSSLGHLRDVECVLWNKIQ